MSVGVYSLYFFSQNTGTVVNQFISTRHPTTARADLNISRWSPICGDFPRYFSFLVRLSLVTGCSSSTYFRWKGCPVACPKDNIQTVKRIFFYQSILAIYSASTEHLLSYLNRTVTSLVFLSFSKKSRDHGVCSRYLLYGLVRTSTTGLKQVYRSSLAIL